MRYKDLTEAQRLEVCNGCGGKGGLVKPPHHHFFKEECNHHDFNYFLGFLEEHRKKADKQLLEAMYKKVQTLSWYNRLRYYPWCKLYYIGVRTSGAKYFYYSDKEQSI